MILARRNIIMKKENSITKPVVQALVIAAALLGVFVANRTYHYEVVVRGILGLVMIYLIIRTLWSSRSDDVPFLFSKNIKYVFSTFFYAMVFFWATQQVIEMIFFLMN